VSFFFRIFKMHITDLTMATVLFLSSTMPPFAKKDCFQHRELSWSSLVVIMRYLKFVKIRFFIIWVRVPSTLQRTLPWLG